MRLEFFKMRLAYFKMRLAKFEMQGAFFSITKRYNCVILVPLNIADIQKIANPI